MIFFLYKNNTLIFLKLIVVKKYLKASIKSIKWEALVYPTYICFMIYDLSVQADNLMKSRKFIWVLQNYFMYFGPLIG